MEFVLVLFCTHSPSVALRRQLPPGGSLKLVPLGRAINDRPYTQEMLYGGNLRTVETPVPTWFTRYSFCAPQIFILRSRISSRSDFIHRRWISSGGEVLPRRQDIIAWAAKPTPGRGFEEVYTRAGHKPKSVPHKRRTKVPLLRAKKEARCSHFLPWVAIPFLGSFGGARGAFFKRPLE